MLAGTTRYSLSYDDTLQEKHGQHFENYQKFFDHAHHDGKNYLNGHDFLALDVQILVLCQDSTTTYVAAPIACWQSKLQMATDLIGRLMSVAPDALQVILLRDSLPKERSACRCQVVWQP